ncbi:hypothetical protein HZC00_00660 [Candidatus Kaiserbacteria bacterium]|nr:hypothetical protein [Candidatus Kaiserbacteria bacterium]
MLTSYCLLITAVIILGFNALAYAHESQPSEDPFATWGKSSADLCIRQAHPQTWDAFETSQFKQPRSVSVCLSDHVQALSVCARTAINREDAGDNRSPATLALQKACRHALQTIQEKYGPYTEDIPKVIVELAYRTPAERKLDMVLETKAGALGFPERQFRWCTKLFGKEQRQCERGYQAYVHTFGTARYERLVRRFVTRMIVECRKHLGKDCGI